jgi:uncharacterized protein with NRDE domain
LCTLVAIHRQVQGAPLIIAANRDEYYDRSAEGPALRFFRDPEASDPHPPILAPLDVRAGGTWFGLNAFGVFGAVTNLRCPSPDPGRQSRGGVVPQALRQPTAARAADVLKALPERAFNPFHCFVADSEHAFLLAYREAPQVRELEPGAYVVGNVDPHEEPAPKVERVTALAEAAARRPAAKILDELGRICSEHASGGGGIADTCVHLDAYGTRSSALLMLSQDRSESRLLCSASAPCTSEYQDRSGLLDELFQLSIPDSCSSAGSEFFNSPRKAEPNGELLRGDQR